MAQDENNFVLSDWSAQSSQVPKPKLRRLGEKAGVFPYLYRTNQYINHLTDHCPEPMSHAWFASVDESGI